MPRFALETRVALCMHYKEVPKTTATGPLALAALENSELFVHGLRQSPLDLNPLFDVGRQVLLLYPSEDAVVLDEDFRKLDPRPITLVVPDGSWRQAARAARRIPGLERARRVVLPKERPTEWGLRSEPKDGGLATFEAIARALGLLESRQVQEELEALFRRMVSETFAMRGGVVEEKSARSLPLPPAPSEVEEPLEILHRDEHVVVVNKPAGLLVHRGWADDARPALQRVRDQVGARVYPVHRLDRSTSGVLLFALSPEDARLCQAEFDAGRVNKRYLALCRGTDPSLGVVDHPLSNEDGSEKKPAVTHFRLLGASGRYGLYEARPLTGRTHQIRRHLKYMSHPIIGDVRYGKGEHNRYFRERFGFHRLALHAESLEMLHPRTGETMIWRAPLPAAFSKVLSELGIVT